MLHGMAAGGAEAAIGGWGGNSGADGSAAGMGKQSAGGHLGGN